MAGEFPEHPPLTIGGIQTVTWQLSSALMRMSGVEVSALSVEKWLDSSAWVSKACHAGIDAQYVRSPRHVPNVVTAWTSDAWVVQHRAKRLGPDLVHGHGQAGYSVGTIRSGLPHVVTMHGILTQEKAANDRAWRSRLRESTWSSLENWVLRKVKHLIVISPHVLDSVSPRTSASLHLIPNAVSDDFFGLTRVASATPTVLAVGWLDPRKRQDMLIRAMALVHKQREDVRLRIVGNAPPRGADYAEKLAALVRELDLETVVSIESAVSQERLNEYYATSWLLAHCAVEESSPMAIAQALASGLPVVAVDIPGVRHLVTDNVNGYRNGIDDEVSLASKLLDALESRAKLDGMSVAARTSASKFSQAAVAAETSELYHAILAGAR